MNAALTLNYRQPQMTVRCVRSLLEDGWGPILVWDNSEDAGRSAAQIREVFAGEVRVQVVESPVNLGFAAGVNRALRWLGDHGVSGPVLIINNDAVIVPGAREAMLSALEADPELAVVAPLVEQDGMIHGWMYYQPWFGFVLRRKVPGAVAYLSGCCLLVNKAVLGERLFDEDFFMYGEDAELAFRLASAGRRSLLLPDVLVRHLGAASSGAASGYYETWTAKARLVLASKCSKSGASRLLMRSGTIMSLLVRALVRAVRYRCMSPITGVAAAIGGGGATIHRRPGG